MAVTTPLTSEQPSATASHGHNIPPSIIKFYQGLAQAGLSCCDVELGKEISALAFAIMQQLYGVFSLAATLQLTGDCSDLPAYYKITGAMLVNLMMAPGSKQQWTKCRGKYIPGMWVQDIREPQGLPPALAKISALFEVLSVASVGANFAQMFSANVSATGMECVKQYFSFMANALPRLDGAIVALAAMGPQMWAYYHQDSIVTSPWLTSAGYTAGSYLSTAFPIILQLVRGLGNSAENIFWLIIGLLIQIPKTRMLAQQHIHRKTARQPSLGEAQPIQSAAMKEDNKSCCFGSRARKTMVTLGIPVAQTAFNAYSLIAMAKTIFPDQEQLQLILMICAIVLSVVAILVPVGRYGIYF